MSQAYKCDRCGWLYDEQVKSTKRNVIVRPKDRNDYGLVNRTLDLCPRCQEQLDAWIVEKGTFIRDRYNQNDKQKCCSNCKFGDNDNAPICDECDYGNSKWEPKEQIINELADKLEQIEKKQRNYKSNEYNSCSTCKYEDFDSRCERCINSSSWEPKEDQNDKS